MNDDGWLEVGVKMEVDVEVKEEIGGERFCRETRVDDHADVGDGVGGGRGGVGRKMRANGSAKCTCSFLSTNPPVLDLDLDRDRWVVDGGPNEVAAADG